MEEKSAKSVPVVLRYRGGKTERCMTSPNIDNSQQMVRCVREDDAVAEVPFSDLKAVFFLHDPALEATTEESVSGKTIAVEFSDGEIIRGISAEFSPERNGFFMFPLDRSKSEKIFVVNSAIVSIEIEKF